MSSATSVTNPGGMILTLEYINIIEGILSNPLTTEAEYDAAVLEARTMGLDRVRDLHAANLHAINFPATTG